MPSWQAAADAGGREPDDVIDHGGEREVLPPRSAEDSGNVPHVHDMHELGDERMDGAAGRAGVETGADRLDRLGQRPVYRFDHLPLERPRLQVRIQELARKQTHQAPAAALVEVRLEE